MPVCVHVCMHACRKVCSKQIKYTYNMQSFINRYVHMCIHAWFHTFMHMYIHTYKHYSAILFTDHNGNEQENMFTSKTYAMLKPPTWNTIIVMKKTWDFWVSAIREIGIESKSNDTNLIQLWWQKQNFYQKKVHNVKKNSKWRVQMGSIERKPHQTSISHFIFLNS